MVRREDKEEAFCLELKDSNDRAKIGKFYWQYYSEISFGMDSVIKDLFKLEISAKNCFLNIVE